MTQHQLPAHLQNRQVKSLTERAADGMGSSLPPHISINGNSFTFIDAANNEYAPILTFDAAIVDVSDVLCKRYYDKPYERNAATYDPPACWSANGIAPSREASKPQATRCDECKLNERGSAISNVSGKEIKACRDERWIAILHPQMPTMVFQFVITPGSFKNWKAYTESFRNFGVELSLALTRFSFVPKSTGEILFEHVGWIDAPTADAVEAAVREKKTDALVGRLDVPRGANQALGAPVQQQTLPPANQFQQPQQQIPQQGQQEVIPPNTPFAQVAGPQQTVSQAPQMTIPSGPAQAAGSSSEAPAPRRRRTKAEMEAAGAATTQQIPGANLQPFQLSGQALPNPSFTPNAAPQTPFPTGQAEQPAGNPAPQFGMAAGAQMHPEMLKMLADLGFVKQG